jgi:hypothetical protein
METIKKIENMVKDFERKSYARVASFSSYCDGSYVVVYETLYSKGWKEKVFSKNHVDLYLN